MGTNEGCEESRARGVFDIGEHSLREQSSQSGDVISIGFDFMVLGEDGRIRTGYQFIEA